MENFAANFSKGVFIWKQKVCVMELEIGASLKGMNFLPKGANVRENIYTGQDYLPSNCIHPC